MRIASRRHGCCLRERCTPTWSTGLALEAARAAQHVLNMCIRALDYCPPVALTFGDYLRALITADNRYRSG